MTTYCGKSDRGMPGSQNMCRTRNNGWDGQCRDCRIKDLEAIIAEVHSWIVCAAIAPPEDLIKNAERIAEITTPKP